MLSILAAAVAATASQPPVLPEALYLICMGEGQSPPRPAAASDNFQDVAEIDLHDGRWRLRGPTRLLPSTFGDGWRQIEKLKIDAHTVSGSVTVNFINRAILTLSRSTGHIELSDDAGSFSGMCDDTVLPESR